MFWAGPSFVIPLTLRGVADFAKMHTQERQKRQQLGGQAEEDDIMSIIINDTEKMKTQDPSLATDSCELRANYLAKQPRWSLVAEVQ